MPNTFTSNVFSSTYKDDFDSSDNFHRILFKSGRALQARELTQMQTIIQEEIERFGRNIFTDGAAVNPGGPSINNSYPFVKLASTPTDGPGLVGTELTGADSTVKARVLEYVAPIGNDPATIYVQYTNTSGGNSGASSVTFNPGESIGSVSVQQNNTAEDPAVGFGCKIHNDAGDFFVRGHFVRANAQGIILSKYSKSPTATVGFKVTEDIVTTADDTSLFDNQGNVPNTTAPGADRYRIRMELTTQAIVDALVAGGTPTNFMYYCRVLDGRIVDQVRGTDSYSKINDLLATRTKEESGNYIAKRFSTDLSQTNDKTKSVITVSPGLAYVNGYRAENEFSTVLEIPKSRNKSEAKLEDTGVGYGQYFICNTLKGRLDTNTLQTVNLSTHATDPSSSTIGNAKVRYVEKDGSNFKVYLFDIKMDSGEQLRNIKCLGIDANNVAVIVREGSSGSEKAVIKESTNTSLVFPLDHTRPFSISLPSFKVQRIVTGTSDGAGAMSIAGQLNVGDASGESYTDLSEIIVTRQNGAEVTGFTATSSSSGTATLSFTGLGVNNTALIVYAKVNKTAVRTRSKVISADIEVTGDVLTDAETGVKYVDLLKTDIHSVSEIRKTNSSGEDVSSLFSIDNGQRVSHYDKGRLVLNGGASDPGTDVYVKFKHFIHGDGDFFTVNSYPDPYEDIPDYKVDDRTILNLRDVIDFRSSVNAASGASAFTGGTTGGVNEVPQNGDTINFTAQYYLRRSDKIYINTQGVVEVKQGTPGFNSPIPPAPEGTLGLFEVEHNPYGLTAKDVVVRPIEAKRFTMRDIGRLEKRVDKLEEVTSLSLLELDTSSLLVLDADGRPRSKSGFFVDNFTDRSFSDVQNPEYRAAINPTSGVLQPQQIEDNIILRYNATKSSNTVLKGDTVYINHTHTPAIEQLKVTGFENVNPFAVLTGVGNLELSPASDEWIDTITLPDVVIEETAIEEVGDPLYLGTGYPVFFATALSFPIGSGFTGNLQGNYGEIPYGQGCYAAAATWNHTGAMISETPGNEEFVRKDPDSPTGFSPNIVVGSYVINEITDTVEVSRISIPFIRPRIVNFKAQGLRPNTRFYPFFDGVSVDAYVREESTFKSMSDDTNYEKNSGEKLGFGGVHPGGQTQLISDDNGQIIGSFFIPNYPSVDGSTPLQFSTGTREFKLLDISTNNDNDATSRAARNYTASGILREEQNTVVSTRVEQIRPVIWTDFQQVDQRDPLAQTFRVTDPYGMFLTKLDLFFKKKDSSIPVEVQIRPVVNGVPSSTNIIANAVKFVNPGPSDGGPVFLPASQTSTAVLAAPTNFEFDEPIFLQPDTEYAVVVLAESNEYEAYVAETYAFELGSTEKKVNKQPAMGSLFKSQNGSTWEPDQTKDLMFRLYKAVFDTADGYAVFENGEVQRQTLLSNPLYLENGGTEVKVLVPNHSFFVGDSIDIRGLDSDANTRYNGILGTDIMGSRTITKVDGFGLTFEVDGIPDDTQDSATSSGRFGGARGSLTIDKQIGMDGMIPYFTSLTPETTDLKYNVKFTSGKSLASTNQTAYITDATFTTDLRLREENLFTSPKIIASKVGEANNLAAGTKSLSFKVDMTTKNADVSPLIDASRTSAITLRNMVDNQPSNTVLGYVAETNAFGGSALSKHMTSIQTLEEPAVGLKIILAARRPAGSDFDVYFRTSTDGNNIFATDWTLAAAESAVAPDARNFREYRYLLGGVGGTLNAFTQYQLKIVLRSNNSSTVPRIKDLRSIALAV